MKQVENDVAILSSHPTVIVWQRSHPTDKLEFAHYETNKDDYEVDYAQLNRWCAASVDRSPAPMIRAALFYVPSVKRRALPPLPEKEDTRLRRSCQMEAIWYQAEAVISTDAIVRGLSAIWGKPNGASFEPGVNGCGLWKNVTAWHRAGMSIWVAYDPSGKAAANSPPRVLIYARRKMPRGFDGMNGPSGRTAGSEDAVAEAAAQIAAENPALTTPLLKRLHCEPGHSVHEDESIAVSRLARWLKASRGLPAGRKAASLLLADFYVTWAECALDWFGSNELQKRFIRLGVKFDAGCPQDGPSFGHNLRRQAEDLDPEGAAGELAGLLSLQDPCSLSGISRPWPDPVIEKGEHMLSHFAPDKWTPYVHYALARAHDTKLAFAYPGGDPIPGIAPLTRSAMRHEREAAIGNFEDFIREKPEAPESAFAWEEAWRLLAYLPPTRVQFGCTCE